MMMVTGSAVSPPADSRCVDNDLTYQDVRIATQLVVQNFTTWPVALG